MRSVRRQVQHSGGESTKNETAQTNTLRLDQNPLQITEIQMLRRRASTGDLDESQVLVPPSRPVAMQLVGIAMLIGSVLLLVGGALRAQSNMISSGLLFLSMGTIFSSDLLRRIIVFRIAILFLAVFGLYFALTT